MKKCIKLLKLILLILIAINVKVNASTEQTYNVQYNVCMQKNGWQNEWLSNEETAGNARRGTKH